MDSRVCKKCYKGFIPRQWNQKYCGSYSNKTGCSWQNALDLKRQDNIKRQKDPVQSERRRARDRKRKRQQRAENTPYAQRQRESKRRYCQTEHGKKTTNAWRKKNIHKILHWNKRRKNKQRGALGSHSIEEWELLKSKTGNKCWLCGIDEEALKVKWEGTSFTCLTKDHVIPINKGGTDFIENIMPACVSCNAEKHANLNLGNRNPIIMEALAQIVSLADFDELRQTLDEDSTIVCASGFFDPLHPGHTSYLREARKLGDILVVVVNGECATKMKKGKSFMPLYMRANVVAAVKGVDIVIPFEIEEDITVIKALEVIKPDIFAKGGDRMDAATIPEWDVCQELGVEIITGVGDSKVHSSSNLLEDWYYHRLRFFYPTTA